MKGGRRVDISVVLTAHDEGMLACPTLRSAGRACAAAEAAGLTVEFIAVLDDPDPETRDYFAEYAETLAGQPVRGLEVRFKDPGASRNRGIEDAGGRYIAILDADDLWCEDWLVAAYRAAQDDPRPIAWHPHYSVCFGEECSVIEHRDMEDPEFRHLVLLIYNYWTALLFAEQTVLLDIPYKSFDLNISGFGYEDWTWNCDSVSYGIIHKIVNRTSHFVRIKNILHSRNSRSTSLDCLPLPSTPFLCGA